MPDTLVACLSVAVGLIVGLAKTGLPGLGVLAVPIMAIIFPAKESVGALLPILITGDLFAVAFYRRAALWRRLWELFPSVLVGLTLGALALSRLNSDQLKPLLGGLIIGLLALELLRDRLGWNQVPHRPWFIVGIGVLAGFTTTLGNASGPIVSIYFISRGLDKSEFMGTGAWYYLLINCAKVPIYAWQGMITPDTLRFDLMLAPLVIVGALAGYWLLNRIPRRGFKTVVLLLALAGAIRLFV